MVSERIEEQPNVVSSSNALVTSLKILLSVVLLSSSVYTYHTAYPSNEDLDSTRRRLTSLFDGDYVPTHMKGLMEDLASRKKRFAETPPDEMKYWFEFPGPLQVGTLCIPSIFLSNIYIYIYTNQGSNHVWGLIFFFIYNIYIEILLSVL